MVRIVEFNCRCKNALLSECDKHVFAVEHMQIASQQEYIQEIAHLKRESTHSEARHCLIESLTVAPDRHIWNEGEKFHVLELRDIEYCHRTGECIF